VFHDALMDALAHVTIRPGVTTIVAWEHECIRRGLIDALEPDDDRSTRAGKRSMFRTAKSDLLAARMIGIDGQSVADRTRQW
jgi:hypothetical protein